MTSGMHSPVDAVYEGVKELKMSGCASNKNDAKPPQTGADGRRSGKPDRAQQSTNVRSSDRLIGSWTNRPVRSIKGGFATFLLMSRPPRLGQGGEFLLRDIFRLLHTFYDRAYKRKATT